MGTRTTMFSIPCKVSRLGLPGVVAGADVGAGASGFTVAMVVLPAVLVVLRWSCEGAGGRGDELQARWRTVDGCEVTLKGPIALPQ